MSQAYIELRNANTFRGEQVEAYLVPDDDDGRGPRVMTADQIRRANPNYYGTLPTDQPIDVDHIPTFVSKAHAAHALKRMPDAFFDRYGGEVCKVEMGSMYD